MVPDQPSAGCSPNSTFPSGPVRRSASHDQGGEQRVAGLKRPVKESHRVGALERLPCAFTLLPNPKRSMAFHDFDPYERLLVIARKRGTEAYLMVLAGGDAGLRLGEIIAREWRG